MSTGVDPIVDVDDGGAEDVEAEEALRAERLTVRYPGSSQPALVEVTFAHRRGEVLGIVGRTGAGKTTLCMSLSGLIPRLTGGTSSGELEVDGVDPRAGRKAQMGRRATMVFEDYAAQLTQMTVLQEVTAPLINSGVGLEPAEERARELLERLGLGMLDAATKRTWELSGGQQQRVAIAASLAMDPSVLVLDNVTTMLDPQGRDDVREMMRDAAGGTTLVLVENDTDQLVGLADQLLVLDAGRVAALGPVEELLRDDGLLAEAGVQPPLCLRVARTTGIHGSPLTIDELQRSLDGAGLAHAPPVGSQNEPGEPDVAGRGEAPVVSLSRVTYRYGDGTDAVCDVSLQLHAGEVHALLGANGAGKSTLVKLMVGLLRPSSGQVIVDETNTAERTVAELASAVGIALQNPDEQLTERTVGQEVAFPLQRRRFERAGWFSRRERFDDDAIGCRVRRALELVGLDEDLLDRDPTMMPYGQRKLVAMAQAVVLDPVVVILDEPSGGLDTRATSGLRKAVLRLREAGKAVVIVEHDIDLISEVADSVSVMSGGKVAMSGPLRQVFASDNWAQLARWHLRPSRAAEVAQSVGVGGALTYEELVSSLSLVSRRLSGRR